MKRFLKDPKTYILLIILAPMIMLGMFFFNYYQIYKSSIGNLTDNSNTTNIVVKNPFDDVDIVEDNEEILPTIGEDIEIIEDEEDLNSNINIVESKNQKSNAKGIDKEIDLPNKLESKSYNNIVGTYKSKFEKLQEKQENNLYSLIEKGKAEYIESGSKKTSAISLATKYLNLVNSMEKQSDKEFNSLINNLKNELQSNSYNTDIVKEISDYYNFYKKSLRTQLFKKASDHL